MQIETVKAGAKPLHFIVQLSDLRSAGQSHCATRIGLAFFAAGVRRRSLLTPRTCRSGRTQGARNNAHSIGKMSLRITSPFGAYAQE